MSLEIKIVNATIDIFREKGVKFTMDDLANWSYVNILDTKSQTFLCCTSS